MDSAFVSHETLAHHTHVQPSPKMSFRHSWDVDCHLNWMDAHAIGMAISCGNYSLNFQASMIFKYLTILLGALS